MLNIQSEIRTWLYTQQDWLQELADKLLKQGKLSEEDLAIACQSIKSVNGQKVSQNRNFAGLIQPSLISGELRLCSIGNVHGIENLAPRLPLSFSSGNLTVVYGQNGSGKSSYTRILKKMSGKPRSAMLKSNVFQTAPIEKKCEIEYELEGKRVKCEWHANSEPIDALRAVDFFDSDEANHYLRSESAATYIPPIVGMFESLAVACDQIKSMLQAEQNKLVSSLPQIPHTFANTDVAGKLKGITSNTSDEVFLQLVTWTQESQDQLELLKKRLEATDPLAIAKQYRATKLQADSIAINLKKGALAYGVANLERLKKLQSDALIKRQVASEAAQVGSAVLAQVGSNTWRSLWEAARDYSQIAYPAREFPVTDDARCVLCHQELSLDAKQRLNDFESFVQGKLEGAAKLAESIYNEALANLPNIPTVELINTQCEAAGLTSEDWKTYLIKFWELALCVRNSLIKKDNIETILPVFEVVDAEKILGEHSIALELQAVQYDKDAQTFDRVLATKNKNELEAKQWVSQQHDAVKLEIQRLKQHRTFDGWKSLANSRAVSTKASAISEQIITKNYVNRFNTELQLLGANRLKIELVKSKATKGKILHRLQLKDSKQSHPIELVLSEGERRIIALAAFLADVAEKPMFSSFIFDDPISSLDHDFEWNVATRLAELAKTRQVLIFTHRLSLYGAVEDAAKKLGEDFRDKHLNQICIESFGGIAGHPIGEAVWNSKTTKANNILITRLGEAKRAGESGGGDSYRILAQGICSDFRKLLERTVEDDLLNEIVKRHRRSVTTENRLKMLPLINKEDCQFIDNLMTKYSCFEHSQSMETPIFIPEVLELQSDIDALITWRKEFKGRK
ncbi:AAA family ATPase [Shewanella baltica]|uniref:AAA family ATPase n=1 Tax=Shewanella baltica TaxID=62322 RepID=UPI00217EFC9B|nr:AAA family ATPase [Shewanella baltica]MCS6160286.1 AAA family ATPase [Shewanella baltica]